MIDLDTDPPIIQILKNAHCNGGTYNGDKLPVYRQWPRKKDTWFQQRLAEIAKGESRES